MDINVVIEKFTEKAQDLERHLTALEAIVRNHGAPLEGNSFYYHNSLHRFDELYTKQMNLFWCGLQAQTRICEIGFNAGHSALLMLLGRDKTPIKFTVFDIGTHPYMRPAMEYLAKEFSHVSFECIVGDSVETMGAWVKEHHTVLGTYDVVHVDGGHTEQCILNDFSHARQIVKPDGIVIVDDTNVPYINDVVTRAIANGDEELAVFPTTGYPHRLLRSKPWTNLNIF